VADANVIKQQQNLRSDQREEEVLVETFEIEPQLEMEREAEERQVADESATDVQLFVLSQFIGESGVLLDHTEHEVKELVEKRREQRRKIAATPLLRVPPKGGAFHA
jgi:hypothetical protein